MDPWTYINISPTGDKTSVTYCDTFVRAEHRNIKQKPKVEDSFPFMKEYVIKTTKAILFLPKLLRLNLG